MSWNVAALEMESVSQSWASNFPRLGTGKPDPTSPATRVLFWALGISGGVEPETAVRALSVAYGFLCIVAATFIWWFVWRG